MTFIAYTHLSLQHASQELVVDRPSLMYIIFIRGVLVFNLCSQCLKSNLFRHIYSSLNCNGKALPILSFASSKTSSDPVCPVLRKEKEREKQKENLKESFQLRGLLWS